MKKSTYLLILIYLCINNLNAQNYNVYKKLLDTTISSKHLGYDKNITITVPFEWQKNLDRDFPLVIVFDRQNQRSHNYILNTIDYLTSNDQMPSSIIISVESEDNLRYKETLHKISNEKGLAFENEKFLFEELIPLFENNYKASSFLMLIGHSRYGFYTSSLFCSRINDLNGVISVSPFFGQKNVDITDSIMILNKEDVNSKKYFRFAIGNDFPDDFYKMDSTLKCLNNELVDAKGYFFSQASHNVTPGLMIAKSLYEIFEDWAKIQNTYFSEDFNNLESYTVLKEEVDSIYGSELTFSLGVMNGKGWYFYNEGLYEKAIKAWELMTESFPNFSQGYLAILYAQKELGQELTQTIEKFKKSLSSSQIYSDDEKNQLMQELESLKREN